MRLKHLIAINTIPVFADEELIALGDLGIAKAAPIESILDSNSFLPRVQLMSSSADKCKKGEFSVNHYAFVQGQDFIDLGKEVDILVIHYRAKALDMSGDDIISSYDAESDVFKKIQTDSTKKDSGCMYGPEYLIYVPSQKKFATFFLGSKSARKEARTVQQRLGKAATLKSALVEWKSFSWQVPKCTPCSATFEIPSVDLIKPEVEKFDNPEASNVETADEAPQGRAR